MSRTERIVFALAALGEPGESVALAQGVHAVTAASQNLVRIALVADIPDQAVVRCVEDVMKRDRQLDHAERGAEVSAGDRDVSDGIAAQFIGQLMQFLLRETSCIGWILDFI